MKENFYLPLVTSRMPFLPCVVKWGDNYYGITENSIKGRYWEGYFGEWGNIFIVSQKKENTIYKGNISDLYKLLDLILSDSKDLEIYEETDKMYFLNSKD